MVVAEMVSRKRELLFFRCFPSQTYPVVGSLMQGVVAQRQCRRFRTFWMQIMPAQKSEDETWPHRRGPLNPHLPTVGSIHGIG